VISGFGRIITHSETHGVEKLQEGHFYGG
jgi:hypothetical protein